MTVRKLWILLVSAILLLVVLTPSVMGAQSDEDKELDEMKDYLKDDGSSTSDKKINDDSTGLKITPVMKDGQDLFDKFSFSDESYDLLSLLNYLFYFLASAGTLWIGILTLIELLKGETNAKSIYKDLSSRKTVKGIIVTVLTVKVVYVLIDFIFNYEL